MGLNELKKDHKSKQGLKGGIKNETTTKRKQIGVIYTYRTPRCDCNYRNFGKYATAGFKSGKVKGKENIVC